MFLTKLKVGTLLVLGAVGAAGSAALVYEYAAAGPLGPAAVKPENGPPRDGKDAKDPGERWRQAARRPNLSDREKAAYEQLAQVHRCAFPNVGRSARSFLDLRKDSTGPMNVLYRMGFDVLPQLAEALDDTTPTRTITPIRPEILRANEEPKKKVWPVNELVARLIVEIAERDFVTDREQEPKFPAELRDLNLLGIRDLNAQPGAPADFTKAVLAWYAANRDKTPAERKIADVNDRWFSNRLEAIRWVGEHPSKEGRRAVEKRVDALLEEAKERPNTTLWSEMSECAEALGKVGDKEGLAPVRAVCDYLSSDDRWAAGGVGPARRTLFDAFHGLARFGEKDEAQRRLKAVYEKWQDRMAGDPDKAADLLERAGRW